jgi:hypothetical protein
MAQFQSHLKVVGQEKLLPQGCLEARLENPLVGLGRNSDIQQDRRLLTGASEIRRPRDKTPDTVCRHLKAGRVKETDNLVQMVAANVAPARLRHQGLQKPLDGDKSLRVQHQAKFVRAMAEDVSEDLGQVFQLPGQARHGKDSGKMTSFS